uniref:Xenotropic and polytropic retrovirus receptor 1 homolog n=1 Tax=Cacopsylla melanoneura TaxID=428564 RepID=A0A8D8ZHH5_9HEMI
MKRLRVPPLGEHQSPWTTFKVGVFSGAFFVLLMTVMISGICRRTQDDWRIGVRLFRGPLLFIEFLFLIGINVYGWRSSGVNHVLIFELNPRSHLSEQHIMELAAMLGVVWTLAVLAFLFSGTLGIPPYTTPLFLIIIMTIFLFNPTKTLYYEARFWTLKILTRVLMAPLFHVNFADFWLADQLNSLVPAVLDLQYLVCFYATDDSWMYNSTLPKDPSKCVDKVLYLRPIVACLPAWFRFAQCLRRYSDTKERFPHLANAAKYATTFFVVLFSFLNLELSRRGSPSNVFFYLWILASLISSLYSYVWDIRMDWGLFESSASSEYTLLRDEIVYSSTTYYYVAIIEDLVLRFGWALSLSLTEMGYIHGDLMVSVLSPLEVFRRFIWNFFRLENEHLNNCGKFRAVRDISVAPIDSSDQTLILRMMDDYSGVTNRHRQKASVRQFSVLKRETIDESTDDKEASVRQFSA